MIKFTANIEKFDKQGEKTGWTYICIPVDIAEKILPANKKSFRVKGKLDELQIKGISLLPMGEGNFIMPLNADMRRHLRKTKGDELKVQIEHDPSAYELNSDLMECLMDDQKALGNFQALPKSHQNYFSKFIESAKSEATKAKRIAMTVNAMLMKQTYAEMIRSNKLK